MSKKSKTIQKKARAKQTEDAPEQPEVLLYEVNGGKAIRVFDQGALFAVEKNDGTIDLFAKDRVSYFFRKSGHDLKYSPQGYDVRPEDPKANVTIEELEEECSELTDADRERVAGGLEDGGAKGVDQSHSTNLGVLEPPIRDEKADDK
jgi:hypothetical protein